MPTLNWIGKDAVINHHKKAEGNRQIGELWEKRSKGQCLFVMPTDKKYDVIMAKMKLG